MLLIELTAKVDVPRGSDLRETHVVGERLVPLFPSVRIGDAYNGRLGPGMTRKEPIVESKWVLGLCLTNLLFPALVKGKGIPAGSTIYVNAATGDIERIVEPEAQT